ncbi:MAG: hypothetical protein ACI4V3_07210 [Faecousia sp.]
MKKILALLLCLLLLAALAACKDSASDTAPSSDASTASEASTAADTTAQPTEEDDHNHINYKGLEDASYTIDDVAAAEGREPDFSVDQSDTTIYIYNNVTLDALTFTQVQYTFSDTGNRISCTYTADSGLDEILEGYKSAMTDLYGTPTEGNNSNPVYTWRDGHTANYVMLTQLNETTVQLAFYLKEGAQ